MENVNQTETFQNAEDRAQQEADSVASDRVEQHVTVTDRKSAIPYVWVTYFAANAAMWKDSSGYGSLDPKKAEKHPDVIQIRRVGGNISVESATRLAWLLWRARQVEFWTMDLKKDRVISQQGSAPVVKRGVPTHTWEECLDAAYLGKNSPLHELAFDKRQRFYDAQNAQRDELESIGKILIQPGSTTRTQPAGHGDVLEGQRSDAANATEVNGLARDSGDEQAIRQAGAQADAKVEAAAEKQMEELRKIEAVPPQVRKAKK